MLLPTISSSNNNTTAFNIHTRHRIMPRRKKSQLFSKVPGPTEAQQHSKLMSLAPELRNRIWKLTFKDQIIAMPPRRKGNMKGQSRAPGLLVTCKQIHFEAIKIYYSNVTFSFGSNILLQKRLPQWVRKIGEERKDLITDIWLRFDESAQTSMPHTFGPCQWEVANARWLLQQAQDDVGFEAGVLKVDFREFNSSPMVWEEAPPEFKTGSTALSAWLKVEDPVQAYKECCVKLQAEPILVNSAAGSRLSRWREDMTWRALIAPDW